MSWLRYAILRHEQIDQPHFDLMFETAPGSALATWRAQHWPPAPGEVLVRLRDHRRAYLDYQGAISGGRGSVWRVACGTYRPAINQPDHFRVEFDDGRVLDLRLAPDGQWLVCSPERCA